MADTNKPSMLDFTGDVSENWRKFKQNFEIYMLAPGKSEKLFDIKAAILLKLKSVLYEQFVLFSWKQKEGEPFHLIIIDLRKLVSSCKFVLDKTLQNSRANIRKRTLAEISNQPFQCLQLSETQPVSMSELGATVTVNTVHHQTKYNRLEK
ncbi:hypothetical protein PR048_010279 [Dryococelus australis]|uniref:Uncharacterized protein n=1 Tax=Dryococelus australis TaxID=614101 RepID=A0ABQ9I3D6_9NEOP|nr:hypothetical protein PR048_010279 [Dryococelus australis]